MRVIAHELSEFIKVMGDDTACIGKRPSVPEIRKEIKELKDYTPAEKWEVIEQELAARGRTWDQIVTSATKMAYKHLDLRERSAKARRIGKIRLAMELEREADGFSLDEDML